MTEPLTPPDCDLQDFPYMPLDVRRLRDSDLAATESPEACWSAVLLWSASWHQVPAASLPDDDRVLSSLAGYGRVVKEWLRVKDSALRGWVKCSDGRLYHPVVAEKAREAWDAKRRQRWKTECARIKKHNDRNGTKHQIPDYSEWLSAGCPSGQDLTVPRDKQKCPLPVPEETGSKGEREGERKGNIKEEIPEHALAFLARAEVAPRPSDRPTEAAAACLAMRAEGLADCNPSHPELLALIAAGAAIDVFSDAARSAVSRGKGFGYALGTVRGRMADAAKTASMELAKPAAFGGFKSARQQLIEGGAAAIFDGATHV